jgi:transcriptional regulator with XRE-family HTH domain
MPLSAETVLGRVQRILAQRGLTLAKVSRASKLRFPVNRLHHIPHNFYDALRSGTFSPSLHQIFTLSALSGYQLADWLTVFGFSLDDPARFQASFPACRTVELDARVYDRDARVQWFEEQVPVTLGSRLTPLSQWLTRSTFRKLDSLSGSVRASFRYFKIGSRDAYAFPELLPGSIVRVDSRIRQEQLLTDKPSDRLFAIEHSRGIVCCRLRRAGRGRIALCPKHLPFAQVEFELGTYVRILGVVDLEIRLLANVEPPEVPASLGRFWTPVPFKPRGPFASVGECIRSARLRSGLSFREASERTRTIAKALQHPSYFCAASTLSDCETRRLPPRHIHKMISICAVYRVAVADVFDVAGLRPDAAGDLAIPDEFLGRAHQQTIQTETRSSSFLLEVERQFEEVPYFLRTALPSIFGLRKLSVRDVFWAGANEPFTRPYLTGTTFLVLNRKSKVPKSSLSSPMWAQPLYVLQKRDGSFLCAACSLQNGMLVLRPCVAASRNLIYLRNRIDAEALGIVIGIVRRLL